MHNWLHYDTISINLNKIDKIFYDPDNFFINFYNGSGIVTSFFCKNKNDFEEIKSVVLSATKPIIVQ